MAADNPDWRWIPANRKAYGKGRPGKITGGVQHYTAGGSATAVARWVSRDAPACGHILLGRKGLIIQQVKLADRAYHAGTSRRRKDFWMGKKAMENVNNFTVGVENSNYGKLTRLDNGTFLNPYKKKYKGPAPVELADHLGKMQWWEPYTDETIEANIKVWKFILDQNPDITREAMQRHSDVSPSRKWDPGPHFPWEYVQNEIFGPVAKPVLVEEPVDLYPEEEDEDVAVLSETWGQGFPKEDPELHYDYENEMSMVERVREPEDGSC